MKNFCPVLSLKKAILGLKVAILGLIMAIFWHINGHLEFKMAKQYLQTHMDIHMTSVEPKKGNIRLKMAIFGHFQA